PLRCSPSGWPPDAGNGAVGHGIDEDHAAELRRPGAGQGVLGTANVAGAERTDLAGGPRLLPDPLGSVEAVLGVIDDATPGALGGVAPADVVDDDGVPAGGDPGGLGGRAVLVVRRAREQGGVLARQRLAVLGRQVEVEGQLGAVADGDEDVLLDD